MPETYRLRYFRDINGKPAWLAGMSAIGPYTTTNETEALEFATEQEAKQHPAYAHPLCLLDVERKDEAEGTPT